jgi:hypothetical protein
MINRTQTVSRILESSRHSQRTGPVWRRRGSKSDSANLGITDPCRPRGLLAAIDRYPMYVWRLGIPNSFASQETPTNVVTIERNAMIRITDDGAPRHVGRALVWR